MSDSQRPHGLQPTRLLHPWDFPGKSTGVGCHCLLKVYILLKLISSIGEGNGNPLQCSCLENPRDRGAWWAAIYGVAQSWTQLKRLSSSSRGLQSPWNSPGQNTGVGSRSLLQGIFPTGIKPRSPTLQADSLPDEPQGKPHLLRCSKLSVQKGSG